MPFLYEDEEKQKGLMLQFNMCKGCELCIEACPTKVLEKGTELNDHIQYPPVVIEGKKCTLCGSCELVCPDFAIYVADLKKKKS